MLETITLQCKQSFLYFVIQKWSINTLVIMNMLYLEKNIIRAFLHGNYNSHKHISLAIKINRCDNNMYVTFNIYSVTQRVGYIVA